MQAKLTKRAIDAINATDRDPLVWDTNLPGFGLRCRASGAKYFVVKYRFGGRQRWYTLGRYGPLTPDTARREARKVLGDVARGLDPADAREQARRDLTVSELCDLYVAEGCSTKKPSTIATDRGRIERHIKPLLGKKKARTVTRGDVQRFMSDVAAGKTAVDEKTKPRGRAIVKGGRGTATKAVSLLGTMFTFAVDRGLRQDNPGHGVKTFASRRYERFLSPAELARLGEALATLEQNGENSSAIAAIRMLAMTGCRKSEILGLRWEHIDFDRSCLRDWVLARHRDGAILRDEGRRRRGAQVVDANDRVDRLAESQVVALESRGGGGSREIFGARFEKVVVRVLDCILYHHVNY